MQIFAGSGVPGNGVVLQSAKAQSAGGTVVWFAVCEVRRSSLAFAVSRVNGF